MKTQILFLLFLPYLACSQDAFTFPEDLVVDPNSYYMRVMKVNRIEQQHVYYYKNKEDSTRMDTSVVFDYIVIYDSNQRITSFKYDFQKEHAVWSGQNGQPITYARNPVSRLEPIVNQFDTTYYNYHENVFTYGVYNQLDRIQVLRPDRGGLIDGVFLSEKSHKWTRVETYKDNLLIKKEVYLNDVLHCTETYEYADFSANEVTFPMLQRVSREYSTKNETVLINYY